MAHILLLLLGKVRAFVANRPQDTRRTSCQVMKQATDTRCTGARGGG